MLERIQSRLTPSSLLAWGGSINVVILKMPSFCRGITFVNPVQSPLSLPPPPPLPSPPSPTAPHMFRPHPPGSSWPFPRRLRSASDSVVEPTIGQRHNIGVIDSCTLFDKECCGSHLTMWTGCRFLPSSTSLDGPLPVTLGGLSPIPPMRPLYTPKHPLFLPILTLRRRLKSGICNT